MGLGSGCRAYDFGSQCLFRVCRGLGILGLHVLATEIQSGFAFRILA